MPHLVPVQRAAARVAASLRAQVASRARADHVFAGLEREADGSLGLSEPGMRCDCGQGRRRACRVRAVSAALLLVLVLVLVPAVAPQWARSAYYEYE